MGIRERKEREKAEDRSCRASAQKAPGSADRKRRRIEGELRNRFYRESKQLRERIEDIEKEVGTAEIRIDEIELFLKDPSVCGGRDAFNELLNEYQTLKDRKAVLDEEWLELEIQVEAVKESVWGDQV